MPVALAPASDGMLALIAACHLFIGLPTRIGSGRAFEGR
jgi:hypothetical protein